jgi:Tol biopolymer transport system component
LLVYNQTPDWDTAMRIAIVLPVVGVLTLCASAMPGYSPQDTTEAAFPGASGMIAFVRQLELAQGWGEIFVMDSDGGNQTQISNHPGFDEHPAWSPDGSKIAFSRRPLSGVGSPADIWIMNPDGSNQVNITNTPDRHELRPSWSPFGDRIAFYDLDAIKILNLSDLTVTDLNVLGHSPKWSPDGGRIAFAGLTDPPGVPNVYIMNADGSNPVNVGYPGEISIQSPADWSPDGTRLIYNEKNEVNVMDGCGGNRYNVTYEVEAFGLLGAWSPDGAKIAYWSDNTVLVRNADGTAQQLLASDAYSGGVHWQPLVETPPSPVPGSHNCVSRAPTPSPSPPPSVQPSASPTPTMTTPTIAPIELPRTGVEDVGHSQMPAVVALICCFTAALVSLGSLWMRRNRANSSTLKVPKTPPSRR